MKSEDIVVLFFSLLIYTSELQPSSSSLPGGKSTYHTYGIGLSYRHASFCSLTCRNDNPMPWSTLSPQSGTMNWASGLLYICQTDQEDCYHQEDRTVGTHAHPRPHAPTKRSSVHVLFKQNKFTRSLVTIYFPRRKHRVINYWAKKIQISLPPTPMACWHDSENDT